MGNSAGDSVSGELAGALAQRLKTAHQALAAALSTVVAVEAGLATVAARRHLTAQCHRGVHNACAGDCSCYNCESACECDCHRPIALR